MATATTLTDYPVKAPTALPLRRHAGAAAVAAAVCAVAFATASAPVETEPAVSLPPSTASITSGTPAGFVPNAGQREAHVLYEARTAGMTVTLARRAAVLSPTRGRDLGLHFVGARHAPAPDARGALPGRVNYLVGPPERHRTGLSMYRQVTYPELWPGIDMVFRLSGAGLRYELVVHPGADPRSVRLAWRGARRVSLTPAGALRLDTASGPLIDAPPRTFQRIAGRRVAVPSRYALGAEGRFGFEVGDYDRRRPLVIDPELAWGTYLGGLGVDQPDEVSVDGQGYPYIAGSTRSADFPVTAGAADGTVAAREGFVTKLERDGSGIVWSTFLGGSNDDAVESMAVDRDGHAYAGGVTISTDFPVTAGAFDTRGNNRNDAFVTKLSPDGSRLEYSTYFGQGDVRVTAIDVDRDGNAAFAGTVCCLNSIPTTPGAFQTFNRGHDDAFAAKLNADGSGLVWGTMLGGAAFDWGEDMALGPDGSVYLAGESNGPIQFPVTPGAFDPTHNGGNHDGFVARLKPDGSGLVYASFLGSDASDNVTSVAVDRAGNAYVGGDVPSDGDGLPVTPGAFDTSRDSGEGFVVKVDAAGERVVWGTYLGGEAFFDRVNALAVDTQGSVYAGGLTNSSAFPTTPTAFQRQKGGELVTDGFVTKLDPSGSHLVGSTYIGGADDDLVAALAIDRPGAVFVAGETRSQNFPTTPGAYDRSLAVPVPRPFNCCVDAFAAKLLIRPGPPAAVGLSPDNAVNPVDTRHCVTTAVEDAFGGRLTGVRVAFDVSGSTNTAGAAFTDASGEGVFCYDGPALPGQDTIRAVVDSDGDGAPAEGEPEAVASKQWVPPASTRGCRLRGSGRITTEGDSAIFSGSANATVTGGVGNLRYRTRSFSLRTVRTASVSCEEGRASVFGDASAGGNMVGFRVDGVDGGRHGSLDRYRLRLADGYDSGDQPLDAGNLHVRSK